MQKYAFNLDIHHKLFICNPCLSLLAEADEWYGLGHLWNVWNKYKHFIQ